MHQAEGIYIPELREGVEAEGATVATAATEAEGRVSRIALTRC